ncbi:MAG: ATP-dependent DNA helicase RecQ, partial [Myxococcota bacterium]
MSMQSVLAEVFGFSTFRPGQETATAALSSGQDVQVVLPTGGGKSLCYQVPAIAAAGAGRGPTLVVSPLIALMDDQVAALTERGVAACALHSGIPWADQRQRLRTLSDQVLIYASPERLMNKTLRRALVAVGVAYLVVDEAHCISEWGHDFRPDYRQLGPLRAELGVPVMAATATATPRVLDDIAESLSMSSPVRVLGGTARPNLAFSVEHVRGDIARAARAAALLAEVGFTRRASPGRAVVYVATRKRAQSVAKALRAVGLPADYYHAGRSDSARANVHEAFTESRRPILVATSAFGMGVDLPDVRLVIHAQAPGTLEAYYQQAGRAGRDNAPARCVLLYSPGDTRTQARIRGDSASRPGLAVGGRALADYIYGTTCRQQAFAQHFGVVQPACGCCDVCLRPDEVSEMVAAA